MLEMSLLMHELLLPMHELLPPMRELLLPMHELLPPMRELLPPMLELSPRRRPGSSVFLKVMQSHWMPADAGMTPSELTPKEK